MHAPKAISKLISRVCALNTEKSHDHPVRPCHGLGHSKFKPRVTRSDLHLRMTGLPYQLVLGDRANPHGQDIAIDGELSAATIFESVDLP